MIATENFDIKSDKIEEASSHQPSSNIHESKKPDNVDQTNAKSSNSSSVPSISSSSFNSFANSPNTSISSSPTNKDNNYKKKTTKNHMNYNDPLLNSYQSNYGYYVAPMFGFENIPFSDLNNPLINPYYDYAQQLFGYSNYPTYFPADFTQNWNSTKNYDNRKKDKMFNGQKTNQNSTGQIQRKYKKPFSKRGENEATEVPKPKPKDYDLMKNEQVYVSAYPALPTGSTTENVEENKKVVVEEKNENEIKIKVDNTQSVWSEKKWSEIVTGNKMFQNESIVNYELSNAQNTHSENLEKKLNGLDLNEDESNSKSSNEQADYNKRNFAKSYTKKSNYKKDKFNQNYYYPSINSQTFDYNLQQQFYNDFKNYTYPIKTDFDKSVLEQLNSNEFFYNGEKEGLKESRFFVIKSNSREDVLHSIKHNIWCSTKYGNTKLNQAFSEKQNHPHMSIYLFFSVNTSGMFSGMAEMVSQVDFDAKSDVWTQDKWKGKFEVKWIYFKDVPNSKLKHITLPNNENKPVTHSRDAQEIPFDKGVEMLDVFRSYKHTSTLFDIPIDIYQAENYMYNLMMNTYNNTTQANKYPKYQYRASDYKWKNPSNQVKENTNQEETNRS